MNRAKKKHLKAMKRKAKVQSAKKHQALKIAEKKRKIKTGTEFNPNDTHLWKHTKKVKTFFGEKEVPYFNMHFVDSLGKNTLDNIFWGSDKTPVTEEMVMWFLQSISDLDPMTLSKENRSNPYEQTYTRVELDGLIMWLQGRADGEFLSERRDFFKKHMHLVKNPKMRLMLYTTLTVRSNDYADADDMKKCVKGLTMKEKLILCNWNSTLGSRKELSDLENIINKTCYADDDYSYVYRTFTVRKGQPIRKGIQKSSTTQLEGAGISYSVSKMSAIWVAHWIHKSFAESFGLTAEEMKKCFDRIDHFSTFVKPLQMEDDVYCAIGLFKIHKDNIIGYADSMNEEEVIAHPSDAELVDYRFLNHIDFIASMAVHHFQQSFGQSIESLDVKWSKTSMVNRDAWFDVYRTMVSKKTVEEKKRLLSSWATPSKWSELSQDIMNVVTDLYGGKDKTDFMYQLTTEKSPRFNVGIKERDTGKEHLIEKVWFSARPAPMNFSKVA